MNYPAKVTEYLNELTPERQQEFERVSQIVNTIVPGIGVKVAYGILALIRDDGKWVIYWGAFKDHLSVYPPTFKYTEDEPIPESEVIDRVHRRLQELEGPE